MKTLIRMIAVSGLAMSTAAPLLAQTAMMDPMTMTCADYSAMDKEGMMTTTMHMDAMMAMTPEEQTAAMAMTEEEKTAAMAEMETKAAAMTAEEKATQMTMTEASMTKMQEACKAMPDGTVMDAAKAAM